MKLLQWFKKPSFVSFKTSEGGPGQPTFIPKQPSTEITMLKKGALISVELPGIPEEEIAIEFSGERFKVNAQKSSKFLPDAHYSLDLRLSRMFPEASISTAREYGKAMLFIESDSESEEISLEVA